MYHLPGKVKRGWLRLKWPILDGFHAMGIGKLFLKMRPGARMILYHGIDANGSTQWNSRYTSEDTFEQHLKWLKENCAVISVPDFWAGNFADDRLAVCLTFDDGLANNYSRALPLLKKYKIPAAFYVTPIRSEGYEILWPDLLDLATPFIHDSIQVDGKKFKKNRKGFLAEEFSGVTLKQFGKNGNRKYIVEMMEVLFHHSEFMNNPAMDDYWKLLSDNQIKEIAETPGMMIGSHGLYHSSLGKISPEEAEQEMRQSKKVLEKITGKEIQSIAFPDGSYTRQVVDLAQTAGYKYQLASQFFFEEDLKDDRLRERLGVHPRLSVKNQQYVFLRGKY